MEMLTRNKIYTINTQRWARNGFGCLEILGLVRSYQSDVLVEALPEEDFQRFRDDIWRSRGQLLNYPVSNASVASTIGGGGDSDNTGLDYLGPRLAIYSTHI